MDWDQYLAQQLTAGAVLQVVTNPRAADAVLTDHLGETFEQSLTDLYGAKPKADDKAGEASEVRAPRLRAPACKENAAAAPSSW